MKQYRIVIDSLGSDKGPETVIRGAIKLLNKREDVLVTLLGDKTLIENMLNESSVDASRVKIVDAPDTISNLDNIAEAVFKKPNASVLKGVQELANDETTIGMVTAGNSGAILMGAIKYLIVPGQRPCLCAMIPAEKGGFTCVVDCGASIDVNKTQLHQFAKLGSDFMKKLYKIERPRVALLSNGVERTKGNALVKETFPILEADESINFVGNVEGTNALSGDCDVLVCDGFAGNQILKVTEATATRVIKDIVNYIQKNNKPEMMGLVRNLMGLYDLSNLGGAIVLGVKKTIIKCHGCAGEDAFVNTADILINLEEGKSFLEGKDIREQERN